MIGSRGYKLICGRALLMELSGGDYPNLRPPGGWRSKYTLVLVIYYSLNSEPLVSLFEGYHAGAAATSAYERRWSSPLVFPLSCFFFSGILCAPLISAHITLVCFCTDIISLGVHITSPTCGITARFLEAQHGNNTKTLNRVWCDHASVLLSYSQQVKLF